MKCDALHTVHPHGRGKYDLSGRGVNPHFGSPLRALEVTYFLAPLRSVIAFVLVSTLPGADYAIRAVGLGNPELAILGRIDLALAPFQTAGCQH